MINAWLPGRPAPCHPLSLHPLWWGASTSTLRGLSLPRRQPQAGHPWWWLLPMPLYGLFPPYVLSAVSLALSHRLCLSQAHSSRSHLLPFLSPLPGTLSHAQVEQGCFFLPYHPLLVSASGSDSPSAALKPKEEKSTRFSIGAEASSPHQQRPGLATHRGQEPGR